MALRKASGQGMMDCKKALQEAEGDLEKAMDILRKKGLATLAKRAGRQTTEGIVVSRTGEGGKVAVLATLCCETDFVAGSADFKAAAARLGDYAMACPADEGAENVLETSVNGKKLRDVVVEISSKTGEKIQVGEYARYRLQGPGLIGLYVHFNNKAGAMVELRTGDEACAQNDTVRQTAVDLAMHITAAAPIALDGDGVDEAVIEREKAIFSEQIKNKPPNIIEKIVAGKVNKFLAENCLLRQPFVKDDSLKVADVLQKAGRDCGGQVEAVRFVRFGIG
jgi:elongation factor Ts